MKLMVKGILWFGFYLLLILFPLIVGMDLKIIYVLQDPEPDWGGERGYVTAEVLQRHLPKQFKRMQYFVCGPGPMMDSIEQILPKLGVRPELIHTERFDMV